ncbi:hypothetical protein BX600DRAFT_468806 [Xylariales sp. PMI_506]|nr:hypothetical protein BX600DRAFT_468806 [Xylariales sp. PMI_506]
MFFSTTSQFDPEKDIPDLVGKVILVTGANVGLGKQIVLDLAKHNPARIWLATRSRQRGEEAVVDIAAQVPGAAAVISILNLDLSSFGSIRAAVQRFIQESPRLDLLFLNAGINAPQQTFTERGHETGFGVGHVGHALLTKLLLPTLLRTAELEDKDGAVADVRIIALSSLGHRHTPSGGIDFEHLKSKDPGFNSLAAYGRTKLANILYARELAARYPQLRVVSVHPGVVNTQGRTTATEGKPVLRAWWWLLWKFIAVSLPQGVLGPLWAAIAPEVVSGEYYSPVGVPGKETALARDPDLQRRLWEWTEEELKGETLESGGGLNTTEILVSG